MGRWRCICPACMIYQYFHTLLLSKKVTEHNTVSFFRNKISSPIAIAHMYFFMGFWTKFTVWLTPFSPALFCLPPKGRSATKTVVFTTLKTTNLFLQKIHNDSACTRKKRLRRARRKQKKKHDSIKYCLGPPWLPNNTQKNNLEYHKNTLEYPIVELKVCKISYNITN